MARKAPPGKVAVRFRALLRRCLHTWLCCLDYRAGKWLHRLASTRPLALASRREFLCRNAELQDSLRQVFAPFHHFCPECSCCFNGEIPFQPLDGVLYGVYPPALLREPPASGKTLMVNFYMLLPYPFLRRINRFLPRKTQDSPDDHMNQGDLPPCPALSGSGCSLPWGARPALCVFFACGRFLQAMDWQEYWRYVRLNVRFLRHLSVSLRRVLSEWRQKQSLPP